MKLRFEIGIAIVPGIVMASVLIGIVIVMGFACTIIDHDPSSPTIDHDRAVEDVAYHVAMDQARPDYLVRLDKFGWW